MTNKIVAIQGDQLKNLNVKTDSTIFLANEAQKRGFKSVSYTHLTLPTSDLV